MAWSGAEFGIMRAVHKLPHLSKVVVCCLRISVALPNRLYDAGSGFPLSLKQLIEIFSGHENNDPIIICTGDTP